MDPLNLIKFAAFGMGKAQQADGIEFAYISKGNVVTLALAGTDSLQDLVRSCKISRWQYPWAERGEVHCGYYEGAMRLSNLQLLRQVVRGKRIDLHGHSMGGAVATLLALILADQNPKHVTLTTYGAPSCLAPGFDWPEAIPHKRYICGADPMPRWAPGFEHCHEAKLLPSVIPKWVPGIFDHRLPSYETAIGRN